MSTKLTIPTDHMPESLSLDLYQAARSYQARIEAHLSHRLAAEHGVRIAPSQLGFLSALICGENTASDIARRLGVSRQAAQRQVSEMVAAGYLTLSEDPQRRNQRLIAFTPPGRALIARCRAILAELDRDLAAEADPLRRAARLMSKATAG